MHDRNDSLVVKLVFKSLKSVTFLGNRNVFTGNPVFMDEDKRGHRTQSPQVIPADLCQLIQYSHTKEVFVQEGEYISQRACICF